jgi:hypothetical protein
MAKSLATPNAFVGTAAAAALVHIASLASTAALPYQAPRDGRDEPSGLQGWRRILLPTLVGALGWFAMAALMGATPLAVIGCAPTEAAIGAVAWHVMAMYAPSLALAVFPKAAQPAPLTLGGGLLLAGAVVTFMASSTAAGFFIAAALLGVGWSLVMIGTTLWIHRDGPVSRWLLGIHDGSLLASAILGAVAASAFV